MKRHQNKCPNFNHGRSNAPVRFCPVCGEVVNEAVLIKPCTEEEHAKSRRERSKYCVNCGEQLSRIIFMDFVRKRIQKLCLFPL